MKRFTYLIAFVLLTANSFAQGHFEVAFEGYGQDHMNIFIVSATINGLAMRAGDEIAAFDDSICCGKTILTQSIVSSDFDTFVTLSASKKDEDQSNGYTIDHAITFKMWVSVKNMELSGITAEFINPATGQTITPPTYTPGATAFVKLSVTAAINKIPVTNAGADQSVNESDDVILDGTASSDPDGDPLTYLWTAPAGITLSSTTVAKPTFSAPEVVADTSYTFSLMVDDGTVNSTADEVIINVKQVNKVPVANAGPDQTLIKGVVVTLDGTVSSDPDGDTLTYSWTAPAGITLSSISVARPTFTSPDVNTNSNYSFSLIVNDGSMNSLPDQVIITVKPTNTGPVTNAGADQSVNESDEVILDGTASSDPDGDPLTYLWTAPTGITLSSTTVAKPAFTAPEVVADTNYTFSLMVNDGIINSTADEVIIKVKQVNKVPIANAGSDQTIIEGVVVTLDGTVSLDPEGNTVTYSWTAPAGITLSSTVVAKPAFTAPEVVADTNYTFSLMVNDGIVNSTADEVIIKVKQVNKVPIANAGAEQTLYENSVCTLDGSGSADTDGNTLSYLWTAPAGIILSSNTSKNPTFTVPEIKQDTVLNFSLIVSDGIAFSGPSTVKIFVINEIKTVSEILGTDAIKVYPNPSNGIFNIYGLKANQQNKIEIYSLDGKLISHKKSNSTPVMIDISVQNSGMYLLYIDKNPFKIIKF